MITWWLKFVASILVKGLKHFSWVSENQNQKNQNGKSEPGEKSHGAK